MAPGQTRAHLEVVYDAKEALGREQVVRLGLCLALLEARFKFSQQGRLGLRLELAQKCWVVADAIAAGWQRLGCTVVRKGKRVIKAGAVLN